MRFRDLVATVLGNLRRMRLKIVLTMLGVVIGTASVVMMVSIGAGLQRNIEKTFQQYSIATLITVYSTDMGAPMPTPATGEAQPGSSSKVKPLGDKAVAEIEAVDGVLAVMPRVQANVMNTTFGESQLGMQIYGVSPSALAKFGVEVSEGRMMSGQNEAVVGSAMPAMAVMQLQQGGAGIDPYSPDAPRLDVLGKRLTLEFQKMSTDPASQEAPPVVKQKTLVTGILKTTDPQSDTSVFIPLKTARKYMDSAGKKVYQEILVKTESATASKDVATKINELGYFAQASGNEVQSVSQVFLIIQVVLGGIGGIALLVASLGIANTMTMSIYERTREIGIMKAVGASGRQIRQVFLGEAALIGLVGGIGGLLLALATSSLANLFIKQMLTSSQDPVLGGGDLFYVSAPLAVFAVVFATCIGLVAGILPAIRAANLDPLTALRHE
jgi:putative ABC transport system permease protein